MIETVTVNFLGNLQIYCFEDFTVTYTIYGMIFMILEFWDLKEHAMFFTSCSKATLGF